MAPKNYIHCFQRFQNTKTSVGSVERIQNLAKLITIDESKKIVVLPAMSGTTNALVKISEYLYAEKKKQGSKIQYKCFVLKIY